MIDRKLAGPDSEPLATARRGGVGFMVAARRLKSSVSSPGRSVWDGRSGAPGWPDAGPPLNGRIRRADAAPSGDSGERPRIGSPRREAQAPAPMFRRWRGRSIGPAMGPTPLFQKRFGQPGLRRYNAMVQVVCPFCRLSDLCFFAQRDPASVFRSLSRHFLSTLGVDTMKIVCEGCRSTLRIPDHAEGRRVRCPRCKTKFEAPGSGSDLNETVSGWLMEDMEKARTMVESAEEKLSHLRRRDTPDPSH